MVSKKKGPKKKTMENAANTAAVMAPARDVSNEAYDNESVATTNTVETTESHRKRLKEAWAMLQLEGERKKKKRLKKDVTVDEDNDIESAAVKPADVIVLKTNRNGSITTGSSDKSSITNGGASGLMSSYINSCNQIGLIDSEQDQEHHFKKMTKRYGWRYFKLLEDHRYNYGSDFADFMCNTLKRDISDANTAVWWNGIKHIVQKAMMDVRSACTQAMKRAFIDHCFRLKKAIPAMDDFEKLRENKLCYKIFLELFVSCVVGKDIFKRAIATKKITTFVTVSDEAMTMLILKNNFDLWTEMVEQTEMGEENVKIEKCLAKQLYFEEGKGRGRSWNVEGKMYYNEIYHKIVVDRSKNGIEFDNAYLDDTKIALGNQNTCDKDSNVTATKVSFECMTDFSKGGMMEMFGDNMHIGIEYNPLLNDCNNPGANNIVQL